MSKRTDMKSRIELLKLRLRIFEDDVATSLGFPVSPGREAILREAVACEAKAANHDAMSAEYDRLRESLASADRLDCDVDEVEDIAEAMRKQSDEHHDMRTDVATALGCSDSTDDIIAAVRDRAAELTDARESQRIAEAATVKLARRVELLESMLSWQQGKAAARGLFDRVTSAVRSMRRPSSNS